MSNIRFAYMYRDASNYKQHGEIIFANETLLSLVDIERQIRSFLSEGQIFIAQQVHVEERFFDVMNEDDHPWHEFVSVEETNDAAYDPDHEHKRDIAEFLLDLEKAQHAGWDETNVRVFIQQVEKRKTSSEAIARR